MTPRVLVVQNSTSSGPRRLADWLVDEHVDVDVVVGEQDPLPDSLADYDGLVLLGGGIMPDDDEAAPWLPAERRLAREAIDRDVPTLGICLGGQLLALVGGGEVRAEHGVAERGATRIVPTPDADADPLVRALGSGASMIQNHQDQITALPDGAVLLASSADVVNQAFRLGENVWGLQFHPEAAAADIARWDDAALREQGIDRQRLQDDAAAVHDENTAASRALVCGFADRVRANARSAG